MFDRPPETSSAENQGPGEAPLQDSIERLCALYDRLLGQAPGGMTETASAELKALAGVYDLDIDRADTEVWADLRAVLIRQTAPGDATTPVSTETYTLMLVEDDPEMAADLTALLSEAGHRIIGPFHNAEAAEAMAALQPIDLALLDINLSGEGDGITLARTLKTRWGVRSLFLSGDLPAAARHAELAEALVLKPYTGREVLDAVARIGAG
ncbi:response regulator [Brevundimonas sp.]|jgi:CheY-like chemotaxis protein|uniref:response regulator n=1 Tax=Brevundimonas sp. TaxID=1871086 RepID=UPI003783C157